MGIIDGESVGTEDTDGIVVGKLDVGVDVGAIVGANDGIYVVGVAVGS